MVRVHSPQLVVIFLFDKGLLGIYNKGIGFIPHNITMFIFFVMLTVLQDSAKTQQPVASGKLTTNEFDSVVCRGLRYAYQEKYPEAFETFFTLSCTAPENPLPYLFIAGIYGLYINDFSTDTLKDKLLAYCDTTINLAKKQIKKDKNSAILHLCLGGGHGLKSFCDVTSDKLVSGIQDALSGVGEFSKALELDSSLADAYIGVGAYDYFKYRMLFLMPWARDSQWEEEIKTAGSKSKYLSVLAKAGYAGLLTEEKRFDEAVAVSSELIDSFPESRTFRWLRVKALVGDKNWKNARTDYEKLLELTLAGQPGNLYNESCCRIGLAEALFALGKKEACKKQCEEIITLPPNSKIKKTKERAKNLYKKLLTNNKD